MYHPVIVLPITISVIVVGPPLPIVIVFKPTLPSVTERYQAFLSLCLKKIFIYTVSSVLKISTKSNRFQCEFIYSIFCFKTQNKNRVR